MIVLRCRSIYFSQGTGFCIPSGKAWGTLIGRGKRQLLLKIYTLCNQCGYVGRKRIQHSGELEVKFFATLYKYSWVEMNIWEIVSVLSAVVTKKYPGQWGHRLSREDDTGWRGSVSTTVIRGQFICSKRWGQWQACRWRYYVSERKVCWAHIRESVWVHSRDTWNTQAEKFSALL